MSGKAQYGFFSPHYFTNWGAHLRVQTYRWFDHNGLLGWSRAWLLCHLLGVTAPVGFCVPGRLLPPGAGRRIPPLWLGPWYHVCYAALKVRWPHSLAQHERQPSEAPARPQKETGISDIVVARYGPPSASHHMNAFRANAQ